MLCDCTTYVLMLIFDERKLIMSKFGTARMNHKEKQTISVYQTFSMKEKHKTLFPLFPFHYFIYHSMGLIKTMHTAYANNSENIHKTFVLLFRNLECKPCNLKAWNSFQYEILMQNCLLQDDKTDF